MVFLYFLAFLVLLCYEVPELKPFQNELRDQHAYLHHAWQAADVYLSGYGAPVAYLWQGESR